MMRGLMYKELKQNRMFIILMVITSFFAVFFPPLFSICIEGKSHYNVYENISKNGDCIRVASGIIAYAAAGIIQWLALKIDDSKEWFYFTSATSRGSDGYVGAKYKMIFLMIILQLMCCVLFDHELQYIANNITKCNMPEITTLFSILFSVQLLLRAVEIPVVVKYSTKIAGMIKAGILLVLIIIINVLIAFNPGDIVIKTVSFIVDNKNNNEEIDNILYLIRIAIVGEYYLSYLLSCKLYKKRIEQYTR